MIAQNGLEGAQPQSSAQQAFFADLSDKDQELYNSVKHYTSEEIAKEAKSAFVDIHSSYEEYLQQIFEFLNEASAELAVRLGISASRYVLRFSHDLDGTTSIAQFKNNGPYIFFVKLSVARLTNFAERMRSSPAERGEIIKDLLNEFAHEMYHGYQWINGIDDVGSIPNAADDYEGYFNHPAEVRARVFGEMFAEAVADRDGFLKRLL
jgi:hypothetical protein